MQKVPKRHKKRKKLTSLLRKEIKLVSFLVIFLLIIPNAYAYSSSSSARQTYINARDNIEMDKSFSINFDIPDKWHPFVTNNNSLLISTEFLTIKIIGKNNRILPIIFFWYTPDKHGAKIKFSLAYKSLIEYNDTNEDMVFQHNETVEDRVLPLSLGNWSHSVVGPYNDSITGKTIDVYLWTTGWMTNQQQIPPHPFQPFDENYTWYSTVNVSLVVHLYQRNVTRTVPGSDTVYSVLGGLEAKIDFNVTGWPFLSLNHRLAVELSLDGNAKETSHESNKEKHIFALHMSNGTTKVDPEAVGNETTYSYEHKFLEQPNATENRIDFVSAIKAITHGTFRWVKEAIVTNSTASNIALTNVTASYISNGENLLVYLSYPSFNGTLSHDPTVGVVKTSDIPGNSPPNILSVEYPDQISVGDELEIKINATDDFSVERVEVIFTSPTKYLIKKDASLGQDDLYHCIVSTANWETGIWHFQVRVKDIFDAYTTSKEFEINVLEYGATSEAPFGLDTLVVVIAGVPIDLLWSILGLSIGGFTLLIGFYIRKKKE